MKWMRFHVVRSGGRSAVLYALDWSWSFRRSHDIDVATERLKSRCDQVKSQLLMRNEGWVVWRDGRRGIWTGSLRPERGWLGAQSEWEEWYGVGGCAGGAGDSKERIRPKSRGGMNGIVGGELTDALQHQADNNPVARHAAEGEGGVEGVVAVWGERSWGTGSLISASLHRCQPMEIGTISQRRASRLPIARRPSPPPATASDRQRPSQTRPT